MAIFGKLEDLQKQNLFKGRIKEGLEFLTRLKEDDFNDVVPGKSKKITIDGDKLYASLQRYHGKSYENARPEAHKKYIDLQFILKGEEYIRCAPMSECKEATSYCEENDIFFLTAKDGTMLELRQGYVAILFPEDVHAPCITTGNEDEIWKCVVKVLI
ncbi:MAG: YhcH/YjgK/YiaL family protein [Bacteroidota bacterium]|nr:YhcH/YjgK/YiaL family protein [Bacteroidota bacterium]